MAKLVVSRNQQEEMRRLHPKPAYSRIVSRQLLLTEEMGLEFAYTEPLGNELWLLKVTVWCTIKAPADGQYVRFNIYTGSGLPENYEDVLKWKNILPSADQHGGPVFWQLYDGDNHRSWSMMRFFEATERRFAVVAGRIGAGISFLDVSFEISEG